MLSATKVASVTKLAFNHLDIKTLHRLVALTSLAQKHSGAKIPIFPTYNTKPLR
jgi:hypothetical protein